VSAEAPATAFRARQMVVLSGKGGTGKTSVVAALASLAADAVLADCDVDAADLSLVLDPEQQHREVFRSGLTARIVPERCSGCGECAAYCRFEAISALGGTTSAAGAPVYVVDPLICEGCALCSHVCTCHAVEMFEAERGEWFVSDTRNGPLVHARLGVGGENSGKLVTLVRDRAQEIARQKGATMVLIDGPPGIGCPVIASVTGTDLVLAVTEPTVSGSPDLSRLAELVKGFGLPLVVCINKHDINPNMAERIKESCSAQGLRVVGELSYDLAVVQAQIEGRSIVEYGDSAVAAQIREMWNVVDELLRSMET
jgi:MinD superfamily P-loop ATPase